MGTLASMSSREHVFIYENAAWSTQLILVSLIDIPSDKNNFGSQI